MFRSSTIIREPTLNLAKVIFLLKRSVKLRRYLLCSCVAACCHTTVQTNHMRKHMFGVRNIAPDEHLLRDASRPMLDKIC